MDDPLAFAPGVINPDDITRLKSFISQPAEGRVIRIRAGDVIVREDGDRSSGRIGIFEQRMEPGLKGPVPHYHKRTTEIFLLISGALHITIDGETSRVPSGGFCIVYPGSVHSFDADKVEGAHFLIMFSPPANRITFFEGLEIARKSEGSFDPDELKTFMEEHDQFVVDDTRIRERY